MLEAITPEEALKLFPMPEFRPLQDKAVEKIAKAFSRGFRAVILEAPTGFGKSAVNTTFCRASEKCFYATPQLTLIEQIANDKYLGKYYTVIMGRENYKCYWEPALTVDIGKCARDKSFKCDKFRYCPYWKQKLLAFNSKHVLTSFAYLILEGQTSGPLSLGKRELLILDESHSIDRHLIDHVSIELSPFTLGDDIYRGVRYLFKDEYKDVAEIEGIIEVAYNYAKKYLNTIQKTLDDREISVAEAKLRRKLEDFIMRAEIFLSSEEKEWVWEYKWITLRKTGEKIKYLVVKPVYARSFMYDFLWKRADFYIISSATILDVNRFVKEVGLDLTGAKVYFLRVPSLFPVENRPIIDATVGKLTIDVREQNIGKAVAKIEKILDLHKGQNVAIHAHSYELAETVYKLLRHDLKKRTLIHTSTNRRDVLDIWKRARGLVLISVRFEEGQDWKDDICRAQILLKVPYPDSKEDARVARRLEKKEWVWYKLEALKLVIQAYGRAVRSEKDWAKFYVVDESFVHLIQWAWNWLPQWFREALPPHWRKDKIAEMIRRLKEERKKYGYYKGWTDSMLKRRAIELLEEEAKKMRLKI